MEPTIEELHGAVVALTLLAGVMLASHPMRKELVDAYKRSLKLIDQDPEYESIAGLAQQYGADIVETFGYGAKP
jgi:hypothetical protein